MHEKESRMTGLVAPSAGAVRPVHVHTGPGARARTHTRAHFLTGAHTCSPPSVTNILHVTDSIACSTWGRKMSKRSYHWLQTYCLHCHINLIQKLSKGPLRFISAFTFIFYFWRERSHSCDFLTCTTDFLQYNLSNTAGDSPLSPLWDPFTPPLKENSQKRITATNLKWAFPTPNWNPPQFTQFQTRNLNITA